MLADEPQQNIQIMAALLHDDGAGEPVIAPVTPDKRMGHMKITDIFRMLYSHNPADLTGINDAF